MKDLDHPRFSWMNRELRWTSTWTRGVTDAAEAVDLSGLDDANVTGTGLELLAIDGPETPTFAHDLNFSVG